jgi:formamidopyrimidine-DNA glycosylase
VVALPAPATVSSAPVPELPEVEAYRRLAAGAAGRVIAAVHAPDPWFLKGGLVAPAVEAGLAGRRIVATRRIGKLLLVDTDGPVLGLRFGMTGRLILDGVAAIEELLYSSGRDEPGWDRFVLGFDDGTELRLRDPRRLGGVELDPDEARLGVDAAAVSAAALSRALGASPVALKARLMDQRRLAGVGNLMADEILWRAGLAPGRAAGSLSPAEVRRLHRHLRATVDALLARGGSHLGDMTAERRPGGLCPRDAAPLRRDTVGGRTTWWCPAHQR